MAESMPIDAARWVVGKALSPLSGGFVEAWTASLELGRNVDALKMELLYAEAMLSNARGRQPDNPGLTELLQKLRDLAYDAEDVLDELDYFRIQDELDGTYEAADEHAKGYLHGLILNARHTARSVGSKFKFSWPCNAPQSKRAVQTPKLKFDRVQISERMKDIIEQLKPVCTKVSTVLNLELLGSSRSTAPDIANSRPITTPESIEPKLLGRDTTKNGIKYDITQGKYCDRELTVLPIVGPGGIGKTTLTQYIYKEVEGFDVKTWVCVSLNFNVYRLTEEIAKSISDVSELDEVKRNPDKLIVRRLKHKKFLLVLDDMWNCGNEDEWNRLLVPFRKEQKKGSIILVTTRFPALAEMVKTSDYAIRLEGLADDMFWRLFLVYVFGDEQSGNEHSYLLETGEKIVKKLKGFPLAAKTVGRLLRNRLDLDHWTRVLESKEWELQSGEHDIMPALKLSYDYLPFHLQQCFIYCALFPEDYEFEREELIHLWIGLDIIHSHGQNKRIEDTGLSYLNDLVNHGFLKMDKQEDGRPCYVIHDLLHELVLKVSSYECLSIYSSNVRSIQTPPSIRHLSIIIDDTDVKDKTAFEKRKEDLRTLDKRLKVENLHSLMLFGEYHGSFAKIFANLFREAKALRVIFLSGASYNVEELLHNFSKLVHLRYLRIKEAEFYLEICLPSTISRFYHLRVLDLKGCYDLHDLPRDMSNLVKMRHFLVQDEKLHSDISEVGKVKYLQELRRFEVKKDINGFELRQLGQLVEIGGSLHICNLENVQVKEAVDEAKLEHKNRLHKLILEWDRSHKDPTQEERVLESLKPHSNLRELCIRGHGGTTCPTWLGVNLSTKNLESLCLDDIAWNKLPTLGEMWVVDEHGEEFQGCITGQSFQNLKRLELVKILRLKKWVGNNTCYLFSHLEVLIIRDCSELVELPFSNSTCYQSEQETNINWFPRLRKLNIVDCPGLLSLPPIPWKSGPCFAKIARVGFGFAQIVYSDNYRSELELEIKGDGGQDSVSWKMLAFHNLTELKRLKMEKCPPLPLYHLQMLTSLKFLKIFDSSNVLSPVEGEDHVRCPFSVEHIEINRCDASGKELTQWLSHFPKLTKLIIDNCQKITGLGVVEQRTMKHSLDEIAAEGLLLLPPQIQELDIRLRANSLDDDTARGTGGGGLQGLHSLRSLEMWWCPKFLSSSSGFPFPTSLQDLTLNRVEGTAPLSNLTSLTELRIFNCGDLSGEDLWPLLTQGHLIKLSVYGTPKFFIGSEPSRPHEQELLGHSSKLQELWTDDVAGVLAAPVCGILSSSLTSLVFSDNEEVERFTEEQEKALHLLTSLQDLRFESCEKLQCLPAGLHRLTNLKKLQIWFCPAIRSLAKGGLPSSLQELEIEGCPAIRSLPKDGLPSSLRVLEVWNSDSEELTRQCRELTGAVPIINA